MTDTPEEPKEGENTRIISTAILFMLFLLVINELTLNQVSKIRKKYLILFKFVNNTMVTTLVGIFAGGFLVLLQRATIIQEFKLNFSEFFLIILLPPIIFESAINMQKQMFFKHFGTIVMFAVFGTIIATFLTSFLIYLVSYTGITNTYFDLISCFAFGSLISATDPVAVLSIFKELNTDLMLYILVFGESILNDAISIILYQTTVKVKLSGQMGFEDAILHFLVVFIGSMFLGYIIGILCAYILKKKDQHSAQTIEHIEASVTAIIPWASYLIAEVSLNISNQLLTQGIGLSGIVSLMFCGISMARYALPNLSESGSNLMHRFYHALAYNFENLVFLFIGIGIVSFDLAWKEMGIVLFIFALIIIFLARYFNIVIISFIVNRYRSQSIIARNYRFILWFSGFRGAMAFALSLDSIKIFKENKIGLIMLTITMLFVMINVLNAVIIYSQIFLQGSTILTILEKCKIPNKQYNNLLESYFRNLNDDENDQSHREKGCFHRLKDCISQLDQKILQNRLIMLAKQEIKIEKNNDEQGQDEEQKQLSNQGEIELNEKQIAQMQNQIPLAQNEQ